MSETIIPVTQASPEGLNLSVWAYAGFWRRFGAVSVDFLLLTLALFLIVVPLEMVIGVGQVLTWPISEVTVGISARLMPLFDLKMQVLAWLYFALLESSGLQATLGKKLFGMRVMTVEGKSLTFGRATGRYFAKYISTVLWMLGYVMAAFTPKKQALHDMIAETVVVKRRVN